MSSPAFFSLVSAFQKNSLDPRFGINTLRSQFDSLALALKSNDEAIYEDIVIQSGVENLVVNARWTDVIESVMKNVCLFIHGGCFIFGKLDIYSDFTARLAQSAQTRVLAVDYSLSPESPYLTALTQIAVAYKYLLDKDYEPNNIVIVSSDAGANLAISSCLNFRALGLPLPKALVCVSPWVDLSLTGKSILTKSNVDPVLNADLLRFCADCYVGAPDHPHILFSSSMDRCDPFVSPFYADLTGLPPLLVMVGESEILLDDAVRFSKKAEFYGVDSTLVVAENMIHGWQLFAPILSEGQQAVKYIGNYIQTKLT